MLNPALPHPPWYRQFWPWFLISIPAASVVAGVLLVVVATTNRDSLVTDDYYKVGISINEALAAAERAQRLGISAELGAVQDRLLTLQLAPDMAAEELELALRHPTQANRDLTIRMIAQGDGRYTGIVETRLEGRWQVVLKSATNSESDWRLQGTWRDPAVQGLILGLRHDD